MGDCIHLNTLTSHNMGLPQTPITYLTVHAYQSGFAGFYTKHR
jgi:hypothetical protein